MPDTPLRGGLIGAGEVSTFHLHAWSRLPEAQIVAVADPNLAQARRRAGEHGIGEEHAYTDLARLLAAEASLDFIDITAPPESHLHLVRQAAAHNLHVSCQKPFAPTLAEAREMIEVARAAGIVLHVHENWRWRPWYRRVRSMVERGRIGRPVYARIQARSGSWLPGTIRDPAHRFYRWDRALIYDWGTHHIDVLRFLFGDVKTAYARLGNLHEEMGADDRAVVILTFGSHEELTALIDLSWSSYDPQGETNRHEYVMEDVRVEGDRGTIRFVRRGPGDEGIRVTTADGVEELPAYTGSPFDAYRQSYVDAHRHFITCLLAGEMTETMAADNLCTLAATLAAYESAGTNEVVDVAAYKETHR